MYRGGSANTAVFNEPVLASDGTIGVACEVLEGATVRDAVLTTAPIGPGLTVTAYETMPVAVELGSSIDRGSRRGRFRSTTGGWWDSGGG